MMLALSNIHASKQNYDSLVGMVLNNPQIQELFNEQLVLEEQETIDFKAGNVTAEQVKSKEMSFDTLVEVIHKLDLSTL